MIKCPWCNKILSVLNTPRQYECYCGESSENICNLKFTCCVNTSRKISSYVIFLDVSDKMTISHTYGASGHVISLNSFSPVEQILSTYQNPKLTLKEAVEGLRRFSKLLIFS